MIRAILKVLKLGPFALRQLRIQTLESLHRHQRQLQISEDEIHKALHPDLRTVLAGKSTILWQQLLEQTSFPDPTLIEEVRKGFELVGVGTVSGAFPMRFKPAQQTPEQLRKQSTWRRKSTISKCSATGDCDADVDLWSQTLNEAEQGWILGPFHDEEEVRGYAPGGSLLCRMKRSVSSTTVCSQV